MAPHTHEPLGPGYLRAAGAFADDRRDPRRAIVTKLGRLPATNDHRRVFAVIKYLETRLTNQLRSV
jgi:hypothetical protein